MSTSASARTLETGVRAGFARAGLGRGADRGRNRRWTFAAVWLVFLAYPISSLLWSHKSTAATVYGLGLIAVFAVVYIVACIRFMPMSVDRTVPTDNRVILTLFAALMGIVVLSVPVLHEGTMAFGPYLIALCTFSFSVWIGAAMTVGLIAIAATAPYVVPGWDFDGSTVVALIVSGGAMVAARNAQLRERDREEAEEQQRQLDEQLAVIAERERVARDVHDILGHSLTVMTVKSELAGRLVDIDPERAKAELAELHSMSRRALAEVRATVGGLRTPDLRTELASARSALTAAEIGADLPHDLPDIAPPRGALFAWVLRESVTNVVRHSGAAHCTVAVDDEHIEVRDDGCGISVHAFGNGLRGLTERVEAAGGQLSVQATGDGTAVRVTLG